MSGIYSIARSRCDNCRKKRQLKTHHYIYGTGNRMNAEKYGLTVRLCSECHRRLHDGKDGLSDKYKRLAQESFETKYSREPWMVVFGKSYL